MSELVNFSIQQQAQRNWCWAAVSVSVMHYFNDRTFATQCALVNSVFTPAENCCQDGANDDCDLSWDISEVLSSYHHLGSDELSAPLDFVTLSREIETNKAPVVIRVQFDDGLTDHVMTIVGCAVDAQHNELIRVADPSGAAGNSSTYELANFPENYRSGCTWENTYQTQAAN